MTVDNGDNSSENNSNAEKGGSKEESAKNVEQKPDSERIDEIAAQVSNLNEELATLVKKQAEENAKLQSGGTTTAEPKSGWEAPEFGAKFIKPETLINPKEKAEVLRIRIEQAEAAARTETEQAEAARVAELTEAIKEYPTERINKELNKLMAKSGSVDMGTPEGKAEREEIRNEIEIYMGELDRRNEENSVKWVDRQREGVGDEMKEPQSQALLRSLGSIEGNIVKDSDHFRSCLQKLKEAAINGEEFKKEDIEQIGLILSMNENFLNKQPYQKVIDELEGITKAQSSKEGVPPEIAKKEVDDLMNDARALLDKQKPGKAEYYDFLKRVADLKKADINEEDGARLQALHNRLVELNSLEMSETERAVLENFENVEDPKDPYTAARIQQIKKGDFSQAIVLESGETFSSIYDFLKRDLMLAESNLEDARTVDRADNEKVSPEKIKEWENIVEKITKAIELIDNLKTKATDIKESVATAPPNATQADFVVDSNGEAEVVNQSRERQETVEDDIYNIALEAIRHRDKSYKVTNTWLQSVCGTDIEGTKALSKALIERGVLGRPDAEYGTMEILLDEKPSDVSKENLSAAMLEDMQNQNKKNKEKGAIRKFLGKRKSEKPTDGNDEATEPASPPQTPPSVDSTPGEVKEKRGFWGRIIGFLGKRSNPKPPR